MGLRLCAGLLCYPGLVLGLPPRCLCHWSLRSARLGSLGLPPVSVLRPVTQYARGAWGCVRCTTLASSGSATRRRRARAGPFGVQRAGQLYGLTGFVDCGRVFLRRQTRVSRPVCAVFAPALWPYERCSFALAHCESCTAPRRVAVELKASQHDSASISKVLKSCCGPRVGASTAGGGTELQQETASTVLPREAR